MDGLTKETYEKVRVKGKFEEVLGNIERFLDLKHELGSPIEADIQIVRLSETDAEVEEFVDRWKQTHADLINIKELDTWGGQIEDVNALEVEEPVDDVNAHRKPCPNLWYHCHIHWDGVLVSCSRDYDAVTPLGNVKNGGVLKTWHGARMQMMRRWHATGNFCAEQCVNCTEWSWWTPGSVLRRRHRRQDGEGGDRGGVRHRRKRHEASPGGRERLRTRPPTVVATPAPGTRTDGGSRLTLRVGWVGPRPAWLELDEAQAELDGRRARAGRRGTGSSPRRRTSRMSRGRRSRSSAASGRRCRRTRSSST